MVSTNSTLSLHLTSTLSDGAGSDAFPVQLARKALWRKTHDIIAILFILMILWIEKTPDDTNDKDYWEKPPR
jgi:hypothetical protein